ncbi:MAG: DNA polymerase III subunit gamma/tau [Alteromonadaceae bacterium]|nr:DNA polymerase III subunit gamma/tau [Alteromonadaceae bacterium]
MTYQVLARKWRPHTFRDLVGQEHVLQALVHSLEQQRLHHAYLFTGTRGVGKTTIGRILARCLNCEQGVSPEPCGVCDSCREVLDGRFVDLIEIDAASRTKVEDMRELLDNVQYSPTRGRFKIYLIDEVHMLSNSSFNALLKTLEEPPEHVKFLFATTDPQKLPVTILSRCLQFNLKRMSPERIVGHLRHVLAEEAIPAEDAALWQLARSADGSMRDALSLTDQAIAYGNQIIEAQAVSNMLGTINQQNVYRLIDALVTGNTAAVLAESAHMAEFSPDYRAVLAELLATFHRIALEQAAPGSTDDAEGDADQVAALAGRLSAEDVQLFYQTCLISRKDLEVTPDARMGFEMALLRMLAFRPGRAEATPDQLRGQAPTRPASTAPDRPGAADGQTQTGPGSREPSGRATAERQAGSDSGAIHDSQNQGSPKSASSTAQSVTAQESGQPGSASAARPQGVPARTSATGGPAGAQSGSSDGVVPDRAGASVSNARGETAGEDRPPWEDESVPVDAYDEAQLDDEGENSPSAAGPAAASPAVTAPQGLDQRSPAETAPAVASLEGDHSAQAKPQQSPATTRSEQEPADAPPKPVPAQPDHQAEPVSAEEFDWTRDFEQLGLSGMTKNLASNGALTITGNIATLALDEGHLRLFNDRHRERLLQALQAVFMSLEKLELVAGDAGDAAPAVRAEQLRVQRQAAAVEAIRQDPNVREFVARFNAEVIEDSIQPV